MNLWLDTVGHEVTWGYNGDRRRGRGCRGDTAEGAVVGRGLEVLGVVVVDVCFASHGQIAVRTGYDDWFGSRSVKGND